LEIKMNIEYTLTTEQVAEIARVKPRTIMLAYWRKGHYYGLSPRKLPNGRLLWPSDARERLLNYEPSAA
jgi:hypothetical protein